jgi:hypothetical protein
MFYSLTQSASQYDVVILWGTMGDKWIKSLYKDMTCAPKHSKAFLPQVVIDKFSRDPNAASNESNHKDMHDRNKDTR